MKYRIEHEPGKSCSFANGRKELIERLKSSKDEVITDIRKVYKNGVSDSVMDLYKCYIRKEEKSCS